MIISPHPKPMAVRVGIALFSVAVALLAWVQATLRVDYEREQAISTAISVTPIWRLHSTITPC
jgi:hypothetical protein